MDNLEILNAACMLDQEGMGGMHLHGASIIDVYISKNSSPTLSSATVSSIK
jgi:hypothetical protein